MQFTHYSKKDFSHNLYGNIIGGVTTAIIALPLALAFGIASGAGALAGIYSAILIGFFAAFFGGTSSQISGPTGPMTVVMTVVFIEFTSQYPDHGMYYAFTTVVLSGVIQILMGFMRLGKYIVMVPYPVVSGFMTGIGIIIISLQVAPLLGFESAANVVQAFKNLPQQIANANIIELALGLVSLIVLFIWRGALDKKIPSAVVVLLLGTSSVFMFDLEKSVSVVGAIEAGLPAFSMPVINSDIALDLLYYSLMLAILGAIDSLLTSLVADNMTKQQHHSDRELIGQGLGNIFAGLFSALPGAGATMRTVVNIKAGGTGPLSGIVHSIILLSVALGFGFLFESIPLAVLSAILIKVGIDIIDWPFLLRANKLPIFTIALMLIVVFITVFIDLITAVFVGVFLKNIIVIQRLSDLELGQITIVTGFEETLPEQVNENEYSILKSSNGKLALVRISGPITYAVSRGLSKRLSQIGNPSTLLLEFSSSSIIGISTALLLEQEIKNWQAKGAQVKLIDTTPNDRAEIKQLGIVELVGQQNCYESFIAAAV